MTYLSVKEASRIAGKNERTVRRWINADKVKWTKIKGRYHVDKKSLSDFVGVGSSRPMSTDEQPASQTKKSTNDTRRGLIYQAQPDGSARPSADNNVVLQSSTKQPDGHQKMSDKKSDNPEEYVRVPVERYKKIIKNINFYPDANLYGKDNRKLEEGQEYILMSDGENMSEKQRHNMSVKKIVKSPITSQEDVLNPVEMSADSGVEMSDSTNASHSNTFHLGDQGAMSGFDGHLSPVSDMPVDNQIDPRGIISSENPFFESNNILSKKMSGQIDKMSGHLNRTIELSGYATRLIEEKERVASKFEEQNDFLKNELTALRKEISALRDIVGAERKKQADLGQILLEDNRKLQDQLAKNYELRITNYEKQIETNVGAGFSRPKSSKSESPESEELGQHMHNGEYKTTPNPSTYVCTCHKPGDIIFDNKYYIIGFWIFAIIILLVSILAIAYMINAIYF